MNLTDDVEQNIELVISASRNCYPDHPVLADLTAAQAILESRLAGRPSRLAVEFNNLFGIKGEGTGKIIDGKLKSKVLLPTKEYSPAHGYEEVDQGFAVNASIEDSILQHKELFENGTRDNPDRYRNLFTAKTFNEAAHMVQEDGYATDASYANKLLTIYNMYVR